MAGDDINATLRAGDQQIATEAAQLAQTRVYFGTQSAATVDAGQDELAHINSVNAQIFETLAVGSTPTATLAIAQAPIEGMMDEFFDQRNYFVKTGLSLSVDPNTGCVQNARSSFEHSNIDTLYMTMIGIGLDTGLEITAEWFREDTLITRDTWTVPQTAPEQCVWFSINITDTDFSPGSWSVTLYADGFQLEEPVPFVITG